jgi:hypothetical protein
MHITYKQAKKEKKKFHSRNRSPHLLLLSQIDSSNACHDYHAHETKETSPHLAAPLNHSHVRMRHQLQIARHEKICTTSLKFKAQLEQNSHLVDSLTWNIQQLNFLIRQWSFSPDWIKVTCSRREYAMNTENSANLNPNNNSYFVLHLTEIFFPSRPLRISY